ncbi:MAG: cytochrome C assembly protein [Dehalococcoidia bacterium]|nr:MAG: cytochrome C assembly protein [Dehalococcoidia bacterium]
MLSRILLALSLVLLVTSLALIFFVVPTERTMGVVQRIFYWHVPLAWNSFLAFFVVFIASVAYLWKRTKNWDILASASAEVGVVFTTLFLISGSIWAKPIWGVWWTWEPRLTTALVLWLIYIAYLLVRAYASSSERGARFAAVVGIVGFLDVPIVFLSITLWRTQHPSAVIFTGGLADPRMILTLVVSIFTFTALYALLLVQRVAFKKGEEDLRRLKRLAESE